jgi:RND family efflux transporter MFP subunit
MRRVLQIALPIAVLAAGCAGGYAIWVAKPEAKPVEPPRILPQVRVLEVASLDHPVTVASQGNVVARARIDLVPQVTGKVVEVSPNLIEGGSFHAGDELLRVDATDYELAVVRQRAEVRRAEFLLMQEKAEAEVARREWEELGQGGEADPLVLREPQVAQAEAEAAAARAALEQAELELSRTTLTAPFDGRVLTESVDKGQYVVAGSPLATLYATDRFEVRLPIDDREVGFLAGSLERFDEEVAPAVRFLATFGGQTRVWHGRILRSSGEVDPRTRLVTLIASITPDGTRETLHVDVRREATPERNAREIAEPIEEALAAIPGLREIRGRSRSDGVELVLEQLEPTIDDETFATVREVLGHVALPEDAAAPAIERVATPVEAPPQLGQFLRAEIQGRTLQGVFPIPRSAMRSDDELVVVERQEDGRDLLFRRRVDVVRRERNTVYVQAGLEVGDRVVVSRLEIVVEGSEVRVLDAPKGNAVDPVPVEGDRETLPGEEQDEQAPPGVGMTENGTPPATPPSPEGNR